MTASARFDDFRTGQAVVLDAPYDEQSAFTLAEVRPLLRAAEQHAMHGAWVAVMVSYEAGPAFDPAQEVHEPTPGLPLAWFCAFHAANHTGLAERSDAPVTVTELQRRGGWQWYGESVDAIREIIASGSAYQINLTDRIDGVLHGDPADLYARMAAAQRGRFNALIHTDRHVLVSASPELFFEVRGNTVTSRPMKGTVKRAARPDDDAAAARQLADSLKDRAENVMITDLLRNDIGRVARIGSVQVPSLLRQERYETVWQLTSTVTGEIDDDLRLVDLFDALFPCGSITGAPKVSAMHHITELEPWARGVYCGAIGVIRPLQFGELRPWSTFNVAIRTAVIDTATGALVYGAGGGITADSQPDDENREMEAKSVVLTTDRPEFRLLETMRSDHGEVQHLDAHLQRVAASADHFDFDLDVAHARELLTRLAADTAEPQRVRLLVARDGTLDTTIDPIGDAPTTVTVRLAAEPVDSHGVFMVHKTTLRATYDAFNAANPDVDDVLLHNHEGEVVESCRANVLYRIGDRWFTPPLRSGGLAGIGRRMLLDGGEVTERVLLVAELGTVDQLQLVSALRGRRDATVLAPA
jgi:para-aminobenzoate synthetase/4-amino-4-deoxychorismate lyase